MNTSSASAAANSRLWPPRYPDGTPAAGPEVEGGLSPHVRAQRAQQQGDLSAAASHLVAVCETAASNPVHIPGHCYQRRLTPSGPYTCRSSHHVGSTQTNPPSWGVDRISQERPPLNKRCAYPASVGSGVTAYIIDTGVRITHRDFGGRASWPGDRPADRGPHRPLPATRTGRHAGHGTAHRWWSVK